jgi:hypothetical protein
MAEVLEKHFSAFCFFGREQDLGRRSTRCGSRSTTSPALHSQHCADVKHMHALNCPNSEFLHLPWDIYAWVEGP